MAKFGMHITVIQSVSATVLIEAENEQAAQALLESIAEEKENALTTKCIIVDSLNRRNLSLSARELIEDMCDKPDNYSGQTVEGVQTLLDDPTYTSDLAARSQEYDLLRKAEKGIPSTQLTPDERHVARHLVKLGLAIETRAGEFVKRRG